MMRPFWYDQLPTLVEEPLL